MSITFLTNEDEKMFAKSINGVKPDPVTGDIVINIPDSGGNADQSGMTAEQISALDGMFKICAYTADATNAYKAFQTAFGIGGEVEPEEPDVPEKTLTSISAVYSGGSVTAGTVANDLTGIVVTAHYSDGTSEAVAGYTLSGTIAEGSNTVTVSYGGKTTTFTVTGTAESGGGEIVYPASEICTETGFLKADGVSVNTTNHKHSDYIAVGRFKEASVYFRTIYITSNFYAFWFYDESKTPISGTNGNTGATSGNATLCELTAAEIPETAAYIVISVESMASQLNASTITLYS